MTHFLKKNTLNVISLELMRILVSILTINGNKSTDYTALKILKMEIDMLENIIKYIREAFFFIPTM